MIGERRQAVVNLVVYSVMALLLAGLQTSLWYHLFGGMTPPALWLLLILFLALFRSTREGILNVFVISAALSVFTGASTGLLTITTLSFYLTYRFFKSRIFWPGLSYFALMSFTSVIVFKLYYWFFSTLLERIPLTKPLFWATVGQTVLTGIMSFLLFPFLRAFDQMLRDEAKEGWSQGDL